MLTSFLSGLARRGVAVAVEGDRLVVRPSDRLTDADRDTLRRHRAELLAYLTGNVPEPWDRLVATHLMEQADAAVEESGVSGCHPDVAASVAVVSARYRAQDLPGLRAACDVMRATVARLAGLAGG
jgi:hypothetical protein